MNLFTRLLKLNKIGLFILSMIVLNSCTIITGDIDPTHDILETPVLRFENNQIIWDYVPNAGSYRLQNGAGFIDSGNQTSPYNIDSSAQNGAYRIVAFPLDAATHVNSIEQKGSESLNVVFVEPTKIDKPILVQSINTLSWTSVEFAESYELYKDGVSVAVTNAITYDIIDANFDGKYTIEAIPSAASRMLGRSELSDALDVVYIAPAKLGKPTITFSANQITWPDVANADTYQLFKDGVALSTTSTSPHTITGSIEDGIYTLVAKSASQPLIYLDSDTSDQIDVLFDSTI